MADNTASDPTFRNYKAEDAAQYAAHRAPYSKQLIQMVIDAHTSTGGQTDSLIDVGCGPGIATRMLTPYFQHVIGLDPGASMIEAARVETLVTKTGEPARFEVCSAEEIDRFAEPGSVDLITAATAAHWFDLPKFYAQAAKLLKPSGSIILWVTGDYYVDDETPNAAEVRAMWQQQETKIDPYKLPGNEHCRQLYANLDLPWTIKTEDESIRKALAQFDQAASSREVFNKDGERDDRFEGGYLKHIKAPLSKLKAMLNTVSPVTRWREANKEALEKGLIEDYVDEAVRLTKETMGKAPGGDSVDVVGFSSSMVIIVIKKEKAPPA